MRVKKLVTVGLSEGRCPTGLPFKMGDGLIMNVIAKKYCVSLQVFNLLQYLFVGWEQRISL